MLQLAMDGINLTGAKLQRAQLSGANLCESFLLYADLTYACLMGARLQRGHLQAAILNSADLRGSDLSDSDLRRADLRASDLTGANLHGANLADADLALANLRGAGLIDCNLAGAVVGGTIFADNDLRSVRGLEKVDHRGPSTIGVDTIFRSKGQIPDVFLRGCGVPEDFIAYAKSFATDPIQLYSCFISYSSKDDIFATELHTKLQAQKVRCWKDSEDLKIGDKFQDIIDSAIRLHDKLLLVLSENSINSSWVEWEVKRALKKEQDQGSTVLYPVRLDDAVMDTPYPWAAEVRKRHIGDFRKWKDHDSFQKSLDRLRRDLRAQAAGAK